MEAPTLRVRWRWLTTAPALSAVTLCSGRLMALDLMVVSVAFWARGSFLPTLCLARLKSMPTPAFFFFDLRSRGMAAAAGAAAELKPTWSAVGHAWTMG